jgi:hypothetical protein
MGWPGASPEGMPAPEDLGARRGAPLLESRSAPTTGGEAAEAQALDRLKGGVL